MARVYKIIFFVEVDFFVDVDLTDNVSGLPHYNVGYICRIYPFVRSDNSLTLISIYSDIFERKTKSKKKDKENDLAVRNLQPEEH